MLLVRFKILFAEITVFDKMPTSLTNFEVVSIRYKFNAHTSFVCSSLNASLLKNSVVVNVQHKKKTETSFSSLVPLFHDSIVVCVMNDNISNQRQFFTQAANGCVCFDATL